MKLLLNGKEIEVNDQCNVEDILQQFINSEFFAVALNKVFLPKAKYKNTVLKDSDQIEIVTPHPGG